jgi:hypothetical protein
LPLIGDVGRNPAGRAIGTRNKPSAEYLYEIYKRSMARACCGTWQFRRAWRTASASSSWSPRNATFDVNVAPTLPKALAEIVVTSQRLIGGAVSSDVGLGR